MSENISYYFDTNDSKWWSYDEESGIWNEWKDEESSEEANFECNNAFNEEITDKDYESVIKNFEDDEDDEKDENAGDEDDDSGDYGGDDDDDGVKNEDNIEAAYDYYDYSDPYNEYYNINNDEYNSINNYNLSKNKTENVNNDNYNTNSSDKYLKVYDINKNNNNSENNSEHYYENIGDNEVSQSYNIYDDIKEKYDHMCDYPSEIDESAYNNINYNEDDTKENHTDYNEENNSYYYNEEVTNNNNNNNNNEEEEEYSSYMNDQYVYNYEEKQEEDGVQEVIPQEAAETIHNEQMVEKQMVEKQMVEEQMVEEQMVEEQEKAKDEKKINDTDNNDSTKKACRYALPTNSHSISERIERLMSHSSTNSSVLSKSNSQKLDSLIQHSFSKPDHSNSMNTSENEKKNVGTGNINNNDREYVIVKNNDTNIEIKGLETKENKNNTESDNEFSDTLTDDNVSSYVPFVRRTTRTLTFKGAGGLNGCLRIYQKKKNELLEASGSKEINDIEIRMANFRRRARELAKKYRQKNETEEDTKDNKEDGKEDTNKPKMKFEDIVFQLQKNKLDDKK
ncbi:hypothetical protein HEP_00199000 [Hepatocystis sp. ex Piliocolobus tephrosceles]|nr:hypothetical protein HEP_00199000 [Hepatocystis sp. ex Piliocolobus tephrosceles]